MATLDSAIQQSDLQQRYDPFSPPQRDDPFPVWAQAREEAPIFYSEVQGVWIVTRHADICEIARDTVRFSSAESTRPTNLAPEARAILEQGYPPEAARSIVNMDPPLHTRFRKYLTATFTPQRIARMEPRIRVLVNELIDAFPSDGKVDFLKQFAHPLPLTVLGEVIGFPREDARRVKWWSDNKVRLQWGRMTTEEAVETARAYVEYLGYLRELVEARRADPHDDVVTTLTSVRVEGETPLSTEEIVGQLQAFVSAGHETTSNLIAHAMIWLLRDREQWEALVADPSLAPAVVEETLRFDAPVMGFLRTATQDVEIGGVRIPAGARLELMYGSANRDAAAFSEPDRFDIRREQSGQHLAFGRGIHYCIGAALARLEGQVALEVLATRLPSLRLDAEREIPYQPNAAFRGPTDLWLEWDSE